MAAITASNNSSRFAFENLLVGSGKWILHIFLLVAGLVYIFPFIWMVGTSFKTPNEFFRLGLQILPQGEWQFQNYVHAWNTANFSQYFFNTLFITVVTVFFILWLTSMAAYTLSKLYVPGKKYILITLGILFFLPAGYTIIPVFEIIQRLGLLNTIWAVVLVQVAGGMMFNTILFYGYMRTIPGELEEAAIIDGATVWQRYRHVILPMTLPMMATVGLFSFMNSWNSFFVPLVFTLGRPELRTLAVGMYQFIGENTRDWTALCAAATISILPLIILFIFLQRQFIEAFAGAVKS